LQLGHTCCCLANLTPPLNSDSDECDSFTFQTVGYGAVELIANAMQLPLVRAPLRGCCVRSTCDYEATDGDEVEDLVLLIQECLRLYPDAEAVACGAVLSDYQRLRVENVCRRLKLTCLAPLWRTPQLQLIDAMLADGIDAIIVKVSHQHFQDSVLLVTYDAPQVAAAGLPLHFLGCRLSAICPELKSIAQLHGLHVAGEGGEYAFARPFEF
jgi:diphthine-ammonia ligase